MAGTFHPFSRLKPRVLTGAPPTLDILKHGIYIKPGTTHPHWKAMFDLGYGPNSRTIWDNRLAELNESPNFRGCQIAVPWGLYEKGASGGDFSQLQTLKDVADEMQAMGKYLILEIGQFKDFVNSNVSTLPLIEQCRYLLPPDLAQLNSGLYTDSVNPGLSHYKFDYAFAGEKGMNVGITYDLKLYKSYLRTRLQTWFNAIADVLADHPAVIAVTTTESAMATPVFTGVGGYYAPEGGTDRNIYDARTILLDMMKAAFPNKMVMQAINFPSTSSLDYVGEWFSALAAKRFAITTPNCNWWNPSLNRAGGLPNPKGALRYFPDFANIAPIFVQWQGVEFDSDDGTANKPDPITSTAGYRQRYADLYLRTLLGNGADKYGLYGNFLIIQRDYTPNVWSGGTTTATSNPFAPVGTVVPSLKEWLKDPANVPQNGTAGLITDYNGYIV